MKVKIYYHDTDAGGVVYYANYLKYMEQARTEFLAQHGLSVKELAAKGILFVVAHQEIDYKSPAFYGDELEIGVKLTNHSTVKLGFEHEVKNQNNQLVCKGKAILVCVDKNIRPQQIPEEIKQAFSLDSLSP